MPELHAHLGDEDEYELKHYPREYSSDPDFWILKIRDQFGREVSLFADDGFDNFIKKLTKLWAEGGGKISGTRNSDNGEY